MTGTRNIIWPDMLGTKDLKQYKSMQSTSVRPPPAFSCRQSEELSVEWRSMQRGRKPVGFCTQMFHSTVLVRSAHPGIAPLPDGWLGCSLQRDKTNLHISWKQSLKIQVNKDRAPPTISRSSLCLQSSPSTLEHPKAVAVLTSTVRRHRERCRTAGNYRHGIWPKRARWNISH